MEQPELQQQEAPTYTFQTVGVFTQSIQNKSPLPATGMTVKEALVALFRNMHGDVPKITGFEETGCGGCPVNDKPHYHATIFGELAA